MKAAETILHLRRAAPAKMKNMVPDHVWNIAAPYDLTPTGAEQRAPAAPDMLRSSDTRATQS